MIPRRSSPGTRKSLLRSRLAVSFVLGLNGVFLAGLGAASPDLRHCEPRGGQRGSELTVKLAGNRLGDAEEIIFHQPGISWSELKTSKNGRTVEVKFKVAQDAKLGAHVFRVRTRSGLSYARRFWVSQYANVSESDSNNTFETPQDISLNVTVDGSTKPETTDYFRFQGKKGQRVSVEVEGLRANSVRGRLSMDPYVAIFDEERFALATADDTPLLRQDCFVSLVLPKDGAYTVEVRDAAYQGNGRYRAHIGEFPRPTAVFPAGGPAGKAVEVTMIGDVKGPYKAKVKLPEQPGSNYDLFAANGGHVPPSSNPLRVSAYGNVLEDEKANDTYKGLKKSSGSLPLAFNGVLQEEGDFDYFRFTAKKGQRFRFRALAKEISSPVDPVMHVFHANGKTIGGNDDADGSADSRYDFKAPQDGDYFVRVYDHLKRGGPDFVYRIETESFDPELLVTMPEFQRRDNQFRKTMDVPRGGRFATLVNIRRQNVRCDAELSIDGLPKGVVMKADKYPSNVTQFPVVFEAAKDAPLQTKLARLVAKGTGDRANLKGQYTQMMDWVRANPNQTLYYTTTEDVLPVTVTEVAPFTLDLEPLGHPLRRNGRANFKVVAKRQEGFTKPITVRWMWRPPGISCNSTVKIPEGKNHANFSISANGNAAMETWKVCAIGESSTSNGVVYSATDLTDLEVANSFVRFDMKLTTVKRGESTEILIDVEELTEFKNDVQVSLVGLPPKTKAENVVLKKGMKQLRIPVQTQKDAPVGKHKNLFCKLEFRENGHEYHQRAGMGGILRVDPQPKKPEPKKKAANVAQAKKADKPKEKPLSRLEQLRLEAKKQAAAQE